MQANDTTPGDNPVTSKRCTKCERELPLTEFYRDKGRRDGHASSCKWCRKEYVRRYYQDNKEELNERNRRYYPRYYQENKEDISERNRRYYPRYYQENKEELNERSRRYRRENSEEISEYKRRYRQAHPEKNVEHLQNRRARERGDGGTVTAKQWQSVLHRFNGKCAKCGSAENIHMDHVVPLAKGGRHDVSNVQPLCATCNFRKGVKVEDYRGKMYQPLSLLIDEDAA